MAVSVTLELADYANDSAGSNPGYRDSHIMDAGGKQSEPTEGNQDTTPGIPLTNLSAVLSSTAPTFNVGSTSLNTVGDIIEIDLERMEVTSINSNISLTVIRPIEGTVAAQHSSGALVSLFIRWQLPVDRISHNFQTPAIPLPLPTTGQGDQVLNKMIDIGMRNENIRCSGVIRDVGIPSMYNIRKQTLLDICRVQFSPTIGQSGEDSDPSNPNAYLRLTIGSGYEPSDYTDSVGSSASTPTLEINMNLVTRDKNNNEENVGRRRTSKSYRGLITDITFELEGGRPDIWRFNFTFYVVKNEHDYVVASS